MVTLYNIACCYSALEAADAGLEALEECLRSGFDDYDKVWCCSFYWCLIAANVVIRTQKLKRAHDLTSFLIELAITVTLQLSTANICQH